MKQQTLLALTASVLLWTVGCSQAPPARGRHARDADIKAIKDCGCRGGKGPSPPKRFDKMAQLLRRRWPSSSLRALRPQLAKKPSKP